MNQSIDDIKQKIVPFLKEAGVKKAALFSSIAKGENTEKSDVDILVDFPRGKGLFAFIGLAQELEAVLQKDVDLVDYQTIKEHIKKSILQSQIAIL